MNTTPLDTVQEGMGVGWEARQKTDEEEMAQVFPSTYGPQASNAGAIERASQ